MSYRHAAIAAAVALSGLSPALASETPSSFNDVSLTQPRMLAEAAQRRPLMSLLDKAGLARPLEQAGIAVYGHVEGSYTLNLNKPSSELNPYRIFDFEDREPLLNQVDLTVERLVDYRKARFDVGFRIEWLYGADAGLIHSNGLFDYYDGIRKPENQLDLPQAYVDIVLPVGPGVRLRAGKFANIVGYETINPNTTGIVDFYSRSLIFFNYPFTHTGILATCDVVKNVTVTLGVSRGDNQSLEDNNGAASFLGSVNWVISDQVAVYLSNSTGPEQPDNSRDLRSTFDLTLFVNPSDQVSLAGSVYYVWEENGAVDGGNAQLYAFALLGACQMNRSLTLKGRVEWIHDGDGFRLGPVEDIYEATVGLTIRPFASDPLGANFKIRPELRWDYSPDEAFNGRHNQVTAAVDVVIGF